MLLALGVAALLLAATLGHYLFWTRRLLVPASEHELLSASTADGWRLTLGRRRAAAPAHRLPVLLLHGLAVNRRFMDFGAERNSLAAHLAAAGFDCYALDLRGHGGSRRGPSRDWCFDDYLTHDVPAALAVVARASGSPRVLLVGHSQGALLALVTAALRPAEIGGVVALAGPVELAPALRAFAHAAFTLGPLARFLARMLAPFTGYLHLGAAQASINTRNVERRVLQRMLVTAVENVPRGVADQFHLWMRSGRFTSRDGSVDYRATLATARAPALFVAGACDGLAPPSAVRAAYGLWGGAKDWLCAAKADGFSMDYGHGDLLFGRRAPEEVFGPVREWLEKAAAEQPPG